MKMEFRTSIGDLQVAEDGRTLSGYVNKTGTWSKPLGAGKQRFTETIAKGAFRSALDKAENVFMLFNHNLSGLPLASTRANTLELEEDEVGLRFNAKLPETSLGKDVHQLVKDGVLTDMSFGFRVKENRWEKVEGEIRRTVEALDLFEVSVVLNGAYASGEVSARSEEVELTEEEQRNLGLIEEIREQDESQGEGKSEEVSELEQLRTENGDLIKQVEVYKDLLGRYKKLAKMEG